MVCSGNKGGTNVQGTWHKSQVCQIIDISKNKKALKLDYNESHS